MGSEIQRREGLSERVVESDRVSTVDGHDLGHERRGWNTPSSVGDLGTGQEMEIHINYIGDIEGVASKTAMKDNQIIIISSISTISVALTTPRYYSEKL